MCGCECMCVRVVRGSIRGGHSFCVVFSLETAAASTRDEDEDVNDRDTVWLAFLFDCMLVFCELTCVLVQDKANKTKIRRL